MTTQLFQAKLKQEFPSHFIVSNSVNKLSKAWIQLVEIGENIFYGTVQPFKDNFFITLSETGFNLPVKFF